MAQPAAANNPFATTSCFEYHMTFDRYCLAPTFLAGKYVIDLAKEKQISKAEDLEKLSFTDTLIPRLLLVAQSIVSAVVLPFKLLISIATGLDALINSKDLKAWANFAYSVTNLSAFTLSIPMGVFAAFFSTKAIQNLATELSKIDAKAAKRSLETILENQTKGVMSLLGI